MYIAHNSLVSGEYAPFWIYYTSKTVQNVHSRLRSTDIFYLKQEIKQEIKSSFYTKVPLPTE